MKVLVTGASGRIGACLVNILVDAGHAVRCLIRPGSMHADNIAQFEVEILEGDVASRSMTEYAVSGMEAVYHLAACHDSSDERRLFETNVLGTENLLLAVSQAIPRPVRFVFASTELLYDTTGFRREPIKEDAPLRYSSLFTASKYMGEMLCLLHMHRKTAPVTIARLPLTLAPGEFLDRQRLPGLHAADYRSQVEAASRLELSPPAREAANRFLGQKLDDDPFIVPRTLDGVSFKRHVGDVRDIAKGLSLILNEDHAVGEIFNLMGWPILWEQFIPYLARQQKKRFIDLPLPIAPIHYECDQSKARNLLGHFPRHDALDMIDAGTGV